VTRSVILWFVSFLFAGPAHAGPRTITILHFSDYHSHAAQLPRAVGYLRQQKQRGAIVFSGGDMINKGSPAWSDKYRCAEWPWLNGIADAMAFGNHDADYGRDVFESCAKALRYPILSANTAGMRKTAVVTAHGVRIGAFALAGPDFPVLVKVEGFTFGERVAAAREAVRELRDHQRVDAVVMIGHEHLDDDFALARAVPGIDVIFGTHSHLKRELTRIEGTDTWFISPFQYLTYISRVELTVDGGKVTRVDGALVPVDDHLPIDKTVARKVASMQRELERDPQYAPLFQPIARLEKGMSVEELGARAVEIMRKVAGADVAVSTASSFRQALPAGVVTLEDLRNALPYDNEIVVVEMTAEELRRLLAASAAEEPLVTSGQAEACPTEGPSPTPAVGKASACPPVKVAVTDYLAGVATRYRAFFGSHDKVRTGLHVRNEVRISFAP
jgi:5'-nucleotidase